MLEETARIRLNRQRRHFRRKIVVEYLPTNGRDGQI
jgi:hypothetical protein